MNQIFEMKLRPDPFNRICSGEKTIEYRLNDEKRSLLNKGDYIRFTEIADEERTVLVKIVDIFPMSTIWGAYQKSVIFEGRVDKCTRMFFYIF
jgi:ASC-1-like (ASCH) protein